MLRTPRTLATVLLLLGTFLYAQEDSSPPAVAETDQAALLEQVKGLDAQVAQTVQKQQAARAEITEALKQTSDLQRQMQQLAKQVEEAKAAITKIEEALKEQRAAAEKAVAKREESKKDAAEAQKALEEAQKKAAETQKAAETSSKEADDAAKVVAASEASIKEMQGGMEKLAASSQQAEKAIADLQQKMQQSEQAIAAAQQERLAYDKNIEQLLKGAGEWVSFTEQIAPIFHQRCLACHNARTAKGRYNMETYAAIMSGGESGAAIDPGDGAHSSLCTMIEDGSMPKDADPLTAEQISLIKKWVSVGARLEAGIDPGKPLIRIMPRFPQPAPPEQYRVAMPITALALSPDGALLASSGYHEILLWSLPEGKLVRRISNVAERVYDLEFHGDGNRLAAATGTPGQLGEVKIFQVDNGTLLMDLLVAEDAMFGVAFSPDGTQLAACGSDRAIHLFDVDSGQAIRTIEDHAEWVNSVAWSPDGKQLVSASRDKTSKIFDVATGNAVITFNGHNEVVNRAVFLPDGQQVISAGRDRRLRVWNVSDAKEVRNIAGYGDDVTDFLLGSDSRVISASADRKVRIHNYADGKVIKEYNGHEDWVYAVCSSPDVATLVSGSYDGRIHVWNVETGDSQANWIAAPGHESPTTAAAP